MIKLLIADDHTLMREGLCQILDWEEDFEVVGEASQGREACRKARILKPDVILMDILMPEMDGVEATHIITEEQPAINVIILTISKKEEHLFEAIKAGAKGYLVKDVDSSKLLETIRKVSSGEAILDSTMAGKILEEFRHLSRQGAKEQARLTPREKDILQLVGQGFSNRAIAKELGIAENTVRNRLSTIFDKLHVNNRTQAARYALRKGLASLDED